MDFFADVFRFSLAMMPGESKVVNDGDWEGVITFLPRVVMGAINHVPWAYRQRLKAAVRHALDVMP